MAEDPKPTMSNTKPELVAYATKHGMTEEEAKAATKQQIVDRFGGDDDGAPDDSTAAPAGGGVAPPTPPPNATTLDTDLASPAVTAPGDAPADTTDPAERASSATPDFGAAARAGHDTVNAVVPVPTKRTRKAAASTPEHRIERYPATRADGTEVEVEHNVDTGETKVIG
ncbi:MAG: hypothetical protein JWM93_3967 [Frankiales bacterium]|nr:hypothetical protein [Frankiales bacterium]